MAQHPLRTVGDSGGAALPKAGARAPLAERLCGGQRLDPAERGGARRLLELSAADRRIRAPAAAAAVKSIILTLALAAAVPAIAGERVVSEATPAFDWDLYHAPQDACRHRGAVRPR